MGRLRKLTDDDFIEVEEVEVRRFSLSYLQDEIAALQAELDNIPAQKEAPDEETLEYWNKMHDFEGYRQRLQRKIQEKQRLVAKAQAVALEMKNPGLGG